MSDIYTIGHSNTPFDKFSYYLTDYSIDTIVDVRSTPMSSRYPEYNIDALRQSLKNLGIDYIFMGHQLGARTNDLSCYENKKVIYSKLAKSKDFLEGINRLKKGASLDRTLSIMCAEGNPLDCHRAILISRELDRIGIKSRHILRDGDCIKAEEFNFLLLSKFGLEQDEIFRTYEERLDEAYLLQEERIAYRYD